MIFNNTFESHAIDKCDWDLTFSAPSQIFTINNDHRPTCCGKAMSKNQGTYIQRV